MRQKVKFISVGIVLILVLVGIFLWFRNYYGKGEITVRDKQEQARDDLSTLLDLSALFIGSQKPNYIFQPPDDKKKEEIKKGISIWQGKQDKNSLDPWLQEAILWSSLNETEKAIQVLDKAEEYFSDDYRLFMNRASFLRLLGRYNEAAKDYLRAIDLSPDKSSPYIELASLIEKFSQDKAKAEIVYNYALQKVPTEQSLELLKSYANFLQKIKKDKNKALYFWQKAYDLTDDKASRQLIEQEIKKIRESLNE